MDHVKKPSERVFHAMLYELCATLMLVPLAAWIMGKSLGQMGGLSLMMAGVAMLCNMLFNALFERAERRWKLRRTMRVRSRRPAVNGRWSPTSGARCRA